MSANFIYGDMLRVCIAWKQIVSGAFFVSLKKPFRRLSVFGYLQVLKKAKRNNEFTVIQKGVKNVFSLTDRLMVFCVIAETAID